MIFHYFSGVSEPRSTPRYGDFAVEDEVRALCTLLYAQVPARISDGFFLALAQEASIVCPAFQSEFLAARLRQALAGLAGSHTYENPCEDCPAEGLSR